MTGAVTAQTLAVASVACGLALLWWPSPPRVATPGDAVSRRGGRSAPALRCWPARAGRVGTMLGAALAVCAFCAVTLMASFAWAIAGAAVVATAVRLVRRARVAARHRRDLSEAAAMLRRLSRDLRAGAAPGDAAAHASAGSPSAVAAVLAGLATGAPGPAPQRAGAEFADLRARLGAGWDLAARHGVPLADVVAAIADDVADRSRAADARVAQVAGPAASGYVLAALPVAGLLLGAGMGADPIAVLTGTAIGSVLLIAGSALCCGGLLWADRIVRG